MGPLPMGRKILAHQQNDRRQRHGVVQTRSQHGRRHEQEPDRQQKQQRHAGDRETVQPGQPSARQPVGHADAQSQKEQNGDDVQEPLPDLRERGKGRDDPLVVHREFA